VFLIVLSNDAIITYVFFCGFGVTGGSWGRVGGLGVNIGSNSRGDQSGQNDEL
jgi:hypothetical protein